MSAVRRAKLHDAGFDGAEFDGAGFDGAGLGNADDMWKWYSNLIGTRT